MCEFSANDLRMEEFVRLLTANQGRIYAYILSLVVNYNDADDVMQDTSAMIWRKFGDFELGTDFLAWAITIAYYRVLELRKQKKRRSGVQFNEKLVGEINEKAPQNISDVNEYKAKLRDCIKKLEKQDVNLLQLRYWDNLHVRDISTRIGKTSRSIYYSLSRIQNTLLLCVQRNLSVEEGL